MPEANGAARGASSDFGGVSEVSCGGGTRGASCGKALLARPTLPPSALSRSSTLPRHSRRKPGPRLAAHHMRHPHPVIPAKAGTHFDLRFYAFVAAPPRADGFQLSLEWRCNCSDVVGYGWLDGLGPGLRRDDGAIVL